MLTVADLQQELKKYRSDMPITLCIRSKTDADGIISSDGHITVYGTLSVVAVHKLDPRADHLRNADGLGLFLTNTQEY